MTNKIKKKSFQIAKKLYYWIILFLMFFFLTKNFFLLEKYRLDYYCLLALVSNIFAILFLTAPFYLMLKKFNNKISFFETTKLHFFSWGAKYLPFKIAPQIIKINFASKNNYNIHNFSIPVILDFLFMITAPLPLIIIGILIMENSKYYFILTIFLILIIFLFFFKRGIVFLYQKMFKLEQINCNEIKDGLKNINIPIIIGLYIIFHILGALAFPLIANSFIDLNFYDYFKFMYIHLLGGFLGTIAIFAPGGIGVRETVQTSFLIGYCDINIAIIISILSRIITIASDFFIVILSWIIKKKQLKLTNFQQTISIREQIDD